MNKNLSLFLILQALAICCLPAAQAATPLKYTQAVRDAAVAEQKEIVDNLDAIQLENNSLIWNADKSMLKVVTWKSQSSYENYLLPFTQSSDSEANVVWVTLAPRMQEFCRNYLHTHPYTSKKNLDLRLKQRLGLHPDWQYDVFVEMWVHPSDLFRPCVDPGPEDSSCQLNFGQTTPQVKNIRDYRVFYENIYYKSYRTAPGTPWTGLGYTYDWAIPKRVVGASEFILSPSSPYVITQALPTLDYCRQ
ncbi:MAG: hypothetical protein PHE55_02845 [Methylococcaceae bacterium]|nr:hypothetical protein [Methylococcaceae bacterium]